MNDFKFTTTFSSVVKPLIPEEKDKYLSLASLVDIGQFVPDIDTSKDVDLLPIAFNAFVANRVNKNDDVVDTLTAADIYKNFINKPINIEHNRERVIGVILTAGFSEFGTDEPLNESDIIDRTSPFNVTLGGVVWRVTNQNLANMIEEASDPTSENYLQISASWELGFTEYNLVLLDENEKNTEAAQIIDASDKIIELEANLRSMGGSGEYEGKKMYRKVVGNVVPLGIGLTETPAADVKGVVTKKSEEKKIEEDSNAEQKELDNSAEQVILENNKKLISQNNENNVETTYRKVMKINKIEDITDESLKEVSASEISDFIQEEVKKASEQFEAEKIEQENAMKAASEKYDNLQKDNEKVNKELEEIKNVLAELEAQKAQQDALERFTVFMASLDEEFDLTDEDRSIIAGDIKDMNEEEFNQYREKMDVLLSGKKKAVASEEVAQAAEEVSATEKSETVQEAVASEQEKPEEVKENNAEEVLENVVAEEQEVIPNSSEVQEATVMEKYQSAFSIDQFDIKL